MYQENTSNIRNELISLFVSSFCVLRARPIRSADGEDGSLSTLHFFTDPALPEAHFEGDTGVILIDSE
jgi:hypothetical protein